jgi:hypothetical protein
MELSLPTVKKNLSWTGDAVTSILENEKYCGDFFMRKNFTVSFLTPQTKTNVGQRRLYYETDHHDAIVSREEQARVLLLLDSGQSSPFYNHEYEIEAIKKGLLSGFIPMNPAFGGYDAGHYFGAFVMADVSETSIEAEVKYVSGMQRVRREFLSNKDLATITLSSRGVAFSAGCIILKQL